MAEGSSRERWAHTSLLCALIANANRNPKKHRPFNASDFDPHARHDRRSRTVAGKHDLRLLREALESTKGHSHA
jgi:hypothetical protein